MIIQTKWVGPTDYQGARVVARCHSRRTVIPWDHALGIEENHNRAAIALAKKSGYVWSHGGYNVSRR